MKIRLTEVLMGEPSGAPGEVVEVSDAIGAATIAAGLAVVVEDPKAEDALPEQPGESDESQPDWVKPKRKKAEK